MDHTAPAILELGLLLLLAALAGMGARAIGLPAVIGYLLVGVLVSPFTPGYVANREQLSILADVGVVLLLFEVGIEINPLRLAREGRRLLLLAPLQVAVTWVLSAAASVALGMSVAGAAIIGLSIAMSSSVVVVNITRSRRRTTDRITDEELLGWSVIQDLVGVSAALVLVVVLGVGGRSGLVAIGGVIAFVALAAVAAYLLPWLLRRLMGEHDLFLLVSVASGLLLAGVGSLYFGIPLALAAFVAGLAITESPVAAEARQRLLPFRDLFEGCLALLLRRRGRRADFLHLALQGRLLLGEPLRLRLQLFAEVLLLADRADEEVACFSRGMRQRLARGDRGPAHRDPPE